MKPVLFIKHIANEGPGTIGEFLDEMKIPYRVLELHAGEALPDEPETCRAVVSLGGPMNVYEEAKHPFLKDEDRFLKRLIQKKVPCLGICLGAQLLVKALGAKVVKSPVEEIGWGEVALTPEAEKGPSLFSGLPEKRLRVVQWHGDTFEMPPGARHLARSEAVPHQAFWYERFIYGFQFHIEANPALLSDWFRSSKELPALLADYRKHEKTYRNAAYHIYRRFFNLAG